MDGVDQETPPMGEDDDGWEVKGQSLLKVKQEVNDERHKIRSQSPVKEFIEITSHERAVAPRYSATS